RAAAPLAARALRGREPERYRRAGRDLDEGIERVARERLLLEPGAKRRRELPGLGRGPEDRERLELEADHARVRARDDGYIDVAVLECPVEALGRRERETVNLV